MTTGTVTVDTRDGAMRLYEARPDGAARGAVVVIQEAFGVNAYVERVAQRAAAAGYHAVAPDLFHRTGAGALPYGDHSVVLPHIAELDDDRLLTDVDATFAHLASEGWQPASIGMVGFCIGGRIAFLAAARRTFGAAVGFYGGGIVTAAERFADRLPSLLPLAASLATPWLGLFGDHDHTIPVADVERLREALATASVPTAIVRYPDAGHAFACDDRPEYDAAAADDGWARTLDWFELHLR